MFRPASASRPKGDTNAITEADPINESEHANKGILKRKVEHWKNQLLDLSKRNKMINYRETKRTTLKILAPEFTELFNRLAVNEEELTFQRPFDKDSDLRTFSMLSLLEALSYPIPVHVGEIKTEDSLAERRIALNNLRSKSKLARDEQGANILYLSFGFIEWRENSASSAPWLRSPVLMMPVSLKLKSIQAPYTLLRYDDDIEVNPTLDHLFNERYGIDLPAFELNGEESIEQYMQNIEEIVEGYGWRLIREVSLGLLSFLKISMYHDLNNNYDRMLKNPVIRAISGDTNAVGNIPIEVIFFDHDSVHPNECYQVLNADSSQQDAILLAKKGFSFVMQGPPGTGKSQTITNIIAEALADGKTVLFVSEKAAALRVVYKRLTEVGLDDFCLALHSHKANKKEILDNIAANLDLPRKQMRDSDMFELTELFQDRMALNRYALDLHEEIPPLGKSLYDVFGELMALRDVPYIQFKIEPPASVSKTSESSAPVSPASISAAPVSSASISAASESSVSPAAISSSAYNTMLYRVAAYEKALQNVGIRFSQNPWAGTVVKTVNRSLRDKLSHNVVGLECLLSVMDESLYEIVTSFELKEACTWADALCVIKIFEAIEKTPLFPMGWLHDEERAKLLETAKQAREEKRMLTFECIYTESLVLNKNAILREWEESVLTIDANAMLRRFKTEYTSFLKIFKAMYHADVKNVRGLSKRMGAKFSDAEIVSMLQQIIEINEEIRWLSDNREILNTARNRDYSKYTEMFGKQIIGVDADWNPIISDLESVGVLLAHENAAIMTESFIRRFCDNADFREKIKTVKADLAYQIGESSRGYAKFKKLFDKTVDFDNMRLSELAGRIAACLDNIMLLDDWLACIETKASCDELGLSDFTDKIEQSDNTLKDVVSIFKRGFYESWVQSVIGGRKTVEQFRRHNHEEKIKRFAALDERQLLIARERLRQRIISGIPDKNMVLSAKDEFGVLQREINKKRRITPLRKLFKTIPNLLLKLKPCMMMSPLSVAYFLEAGLYEFDMVIFDEASQIFPQDAVGSIFRGKQAIIAGDSKQLPPTNFFATSTSNDGGGGFEEEDEDKEDEMEIYDSIFEETAGVLPKRTLLWHYRSKHESLIAFSNRKIYKNELVTFPSSVSDGADTGVEFVFVEDGIYEGKGRNTSEACRCVELVRRHIETSPDRSLGIIAFSESQQKTIVVELQKFREQHPEYEDFFSEDREDEFFVKNLENVQGDERDTIIFSVSYAKTKEQRDGKRPMALRFGPLGQKGGERRLNVAITRAKCNVKLVSSILPSDIDLSHTESEGIKMLRQYIEFAMNGAEVLHTGEREGEKDVFLDIVADFLISHGCKIKKHVGCSEYKIDIAVVHPDNENCFAAGIECDGLYYGGAQSARDRDHLRKSILEAMGWRIFRVWSPEWMARQDIEAEKLLTFIDTAIKEFKEVKV
ncbi:MAG: DUF4011 domain-containing protein [Clostridiales Family XIII bacterium]|jgi:very-short-patch-repair endonuclease|nr:DUF4011 domain-containing protein [Clostridiales Family XIII bacterium]